MSAKSPRINGNITVIDLFMSIFFVPGIIALAFGIDILLKNMGWSKVNALDMSIFGSVACVLLFFWLLNVIGDGLPSRELEPTPEGIAHNETRRLELISTAKRLLALWKQDIHHNSFVDDALFEELENELYRHGISEADSYFFSLYTSQHFMLIYLNEAREGKPSLKGLSWSKAYQLLQGTLDCLEKHDLVADADLIRLTGLKNWKKQTPKRSGNHKGISA